MEIKVAKRMNIKVVAVEVSEARSAMRRLLVAADRGQVELSEYDRMALERAQFVIGQLGR